MLSNGVGWVEGIWAAGGVVGSPSSLEMVLAV